MPGKRKLATPIFLIVITLMAILLVLLYSKVLLNEQTSATDRGERLAAQYGACQAFAGALQGGTEALAGAASAADRLPAMAQLGQLAPLEESCAEVLTRKAVNPDSDEDAAKQQLAAELANIREAALGIGLHEGALSDDEQAQLAVLQAGGAELADMLNAYVVPTAGDRYRQMAAGVEWTQPAGEAAARIAQLAGALGAGK
ncbi:hypothetical protein [Cohnella fermenti]|uniref:Uncharacterized protein n=1 Tax=Cohnella fermenti TaxID=2565925 RepID=A0A4S4BGB3_9BACL|nr:hypothetical protein [Cohnella fermenti]THF72772.1 hypothetical protein E6C55_31945 [Cohnella fermenti]